MPKKSFEKFYGFRKTLFMQSPFKHSFATKFVAPQTQFEPVGRSWPTLRNFIQIYDKSLKTLNIP